jgi:hypothetical protein
MSASAPANRRAAAAACRDALIGAASALVMGLALPCPAAAQNQPGAPPAPPPTATPNEASPKGDLKPPENVKPLPANEAASILGKKVKGPNGEDLGLIVDVLVDPDGQPRAAVIDFGGFLGVGSRKIAVDWRLLKLTPAAPDWKISLNISRDEIQGAPEFKPDAASGQMVGPPPQGPPSHDVDR